MARHEVRVKRSTGTATTAPPVSPRSGVQSVDRALAILDVLGEDAEGYRLADLAARTGLSVSTAHRLLTALESRRYVQFERGQGTWHVGRQVFTVGETFVRRRNFVAAAMPILRSLRDGTRETANLGVSDEGRLIIVAQVESREVVRAISTLGGSAPMTNDALGKALLSTWSESEVAALVARHGMMRVTETTITRLSTLKAELAAIRRDGFALDRGESIAELRCAAAPIFDATGDAVAAISVSGLASRIADDTLTSLGRIVRDAAHKVTDLIGGNRSRA